MKAGHPTNPGARHGHLQRLGCRFGSDGSMVRLSLTIDPERGRRIEVTPSKLEVNEEETVGDFEASGIHAVKVGRLLLFEELECA